MTTPTSTPATGTASTTPAALLPIDAFISPFLVCTQCAAGVLWHKDDRVTNHPCGHQGTRSVCMTWSPAAGCICRERFGTVPHAVPSSVGAPPKTTTPTATAAAAK